MFIMMFLDCDAQMSGSRIKTAGRFKPCLHMGCFDLDTYVELNQRARKVFHLIFVILSVTFYALLHVWRYWNVETAVNSSKTESCSR